MHRAQVLIEEWQFEALKALAERQRRSISALLRDILTQQLQKKPPKKPGKRKYGLEAVDGILNDPRLHAADIDQVVYGKGEALAVEQVFVDSSAWVAFTNKVDPHYAAVRAALYEWDGRLVTSNFVFDEAITWMIYSAHHQIAMRLGEKLWDGQLATLVRVTSDDERMAWELLSRRPDKKYSFTDCTSFVLMRRMNIKVAVSLDSDFRSEGFQTLP